MTDHDKVSVADRLSALKVLFTEWSLRGVPHGISYPTSLAGLLEWTCADHGIHAPLGSKRDISMQKSKYKDDVAAIDELIKKLKPEVSEKKSSWSKKPRVYKTQKARRVVAEDKTRRLETLLDEVTKQWSKKDIEIEVALSSLKFERQERKDLQAALDEARADNAKLLRRLAAHENKLRVVE
jgi:chromosome segregation ATPase